MPFVFRKKTLVAAWEEVRKNQLCAFCSDELDD